ncbi:hypothetical protein V4C53_47865, partial [Paraburkholderia azotifigens]
SAFQPQPGNQPASSVLQKDRILPASLCTGQGHFWKLFLTRSYAASHRAVREMKADGLLPEDTKIRFSKYLNNLLEQDHRNIKS